MSDILRIGLIGCGRILDAHLNGYKSLWDHGEQGFRLVGLCSRRLDDALRYRQRDEGPEPRPPLHGLVGDPMVAPHLYVSDIHDDVEAAVYDDWRTMLDDPELKLDAVVLLTPVAGHHDLALAAIERGLHVFVEKPLAITVAAARRLVESAAARVVQLAVAEVVRFKEVTRMARWCLEHGAIGEAQAVLQFGLGSPWSPDRVHADTPWRHDPLLAGAGVALDFGVHVLHGLEYLCGPITALYASARQLEPRRRRLDGDGQVVETIACAVDDIVQAQLSFASGAIGQVGFSTALRGAKTGVPLTIHGSAGTFRTGTISADGAADQSVVAWFGTRATEADQRAVFPRQLHCPFGLETYSWLESIRSGVPGEVDGVVGLRDLAAAWALVESSAAGEPVTVDEVLNGSRRRAQEVIDRHYGLA